MVNRKQNTLRTRCSTIRVVKLCKKYRTDKTSKVIDNIAKKYGHEVIRLPPYHCDLNTTELIWADEKNYVAHDNREMTLKSVEALF